MSAPKKPNKKGDAPSKGGAKAPAPKAAGKAPAKAEAAPKAAEAAPAVSPPPAEKVASTPARTPVGPPDKSNIAVGEPNPGAPAPGAAHRAFRRKLVGRVTSNKMAKTVVVEVVRSTLDPMYKKYVRSRERYKAHDETDQYKTGDRVEIQEHRPISREKRWIVTKLISRPVEE